MDKRVEKNNAITGGFIDRQGERFYAIHNVDKMPPFFISLISDNDHWFFASSNGGLTAGRGSPDTALFPYITVDKIHDSPSHTGSKTLLRINRDSHQSMWEPFNPEQSCLFNIERNLYKNLLGNKLCFEEINKDLKLLFRYTWMFSEGYGFVRSCELENLNDDLVRVEILDGLQNILPAGTPRFLQTNSSNLVDAYKWTEIDAATGLAMVTLFSGITDRAEPCESLKANTIFCLGASSPRVLLSSDQINNFRSGKELHSESCRRGIRAAYLINTVFDLPAAECSGWQIIANVEQTQSQVVELRSQLNDIQKLTHSLSLSIKAGTDKLAGIMAASDGFQLTQEQNVSAHHYANVVFNVLRGGIFADQYHIDSHDFSKSIKHFNQPVYHSHKKFLKSLPAKIELFELFDVVSSCNDSCLIRLYYEYLPITFGRRHGDPSRPWNEFAIRLKDEHGDSLLTYQGNWRDIFQNWEALCLSYPEYIENIIAKFVNASTLDGYNPYRITKEGIDWEVEDPEDPWSYIGYWGDHQIIYLLKLLELSHKFHPGKLKDLLRQPVFSYANVPYRIKAFDLLLEDPKSTVIYDEQLAAKIAQRISEIGADGKLVLDSHGRVYQVSLIEKLLVPLLSKLGNLVLDGGIWMNTQRPEWNDANNALVGQGLSMVTLYYLRRYIHFIEQLMQNETAAVYITQEVAVWIAETAVAVNDLVGIGESGDISGKVRFQALTKLGQISSRYREAAYEQSGKFRVEVFPLTPIQNLLRDSSILLERSIQKNRREDGLYHAYNILNYQSQQIQINRLYPMLEGQVAILSSATLTPHQSITVIESLFNSAIYRADQNSFMLYPDRQLKSFLQRNVVPADEVESLPVVMQMISDGERSLLVKDVDGHYRFNANISNAGDLIQRIERIQGQHQYNIGSERIPLLSIYEEVFNHQSFTGRSGGMFGFEGLGCIYWHMVSKLLLAVQESFFSALDQRTDEATLRQLGTLYYRVREGIGFNKTPDEYGAFPMDPYSHTPGHAGAQQPGMTGQVKEEIITRFGELGIRVDDGECYFQPRLLRAQEFITEQRGFRYLDCSNSWQQLEVPAQALAFTWCQIPFIYHISDGAETGITVSFNNSETVQLEQMRLPAAISRSVFKRTGEIRLITLHIGSNELFIGSEI